MASEPLPAASLMLDTRFPRLPGDVGHPADASPFPVRHRGRRAARRRSASCARRDPALLQPFIEAGAARCVDEGARRDHHQLRLPRPVPARAAGRAAGAGVDARACSALADELRRPRAASSRSMRRRSARRTCVRPAPTRTRRSKASRRTRACSAPCSTTCADARRAAQAEADVVAAGAAPGGARPEVARDRARVHQPAALCRCGRARHRPAGARHLDHACCTSAGAALDP